MNISIGENIRKMRKQRGVTQEALAERLSVTPQAISRWESGAGCPAIEYLPELAVFFRTSIDELLGVRLSERETRRESIYQDIDRLEDGLDPEHVYDQSAVDFLREAHAMFPGDHRIRFALAKALIETKQDNQPIKAYLQEAEIILRNLIRQADDQSFRFTCICQLAVLYKDAWQDEHGYEEIISMLPSLDSCREYFITNFYTGAMQKPETVLDCVLKLAQWITNVLRDYVAYVFSDDNAGLDRKTSRFLWLIDFLKEVSALMDQEKALPLLLSIAVLYRYAATCHIAGGEEEKALDCLEEMCSHIEAFCTGEKKAGSISGSGSPSACFLLYLDHDRYDPIRKNSRFLAIRSRLESLS